MEIERKYLIHQLPKELETFPSRKIQQAYLCVNPVVRIRRQNDDYYLTYKGKGMMVREEYNLPPDQGSLPAFKRKGGWPCALQNQVSASPSQ